MKNAQMTGVPSRGSVAWDWAQAGWEDARQGKPWRAEYHTCRSPAMQRNYERNRLRVIEMLALGMKVPSWKEARMKPSAIDYATKLIHVTIGYMI